MTLVSEADLSFAVPASAASFVFETILARLMLKERVDAKRWVGAVWAGGVALLACDALILAIVRNRGWYQLFTMIACLIPPAQPGGTRGAPTSRRFDPEARRAGWTLLFGKPSGRMRAARRI